MAMPDSLNDRQKQSYRDVGVGLTALATIPTEYVGGLIFDQVSTTLFYVGEGTFGALTSEPKWFIKRFDLTTGVVIKLASQDYDQVWDDRAALTYV